MHMRSSAHDVTLVVLVGRVHRAGTCCTVRARRASPQPKSATRHPAGLPRSQSMATSTGCRGHPAVCCLKPSWYCWYRSGSSWRHNRVQTVHLVAGLGRRRVSVR